MNFATEVFGMLAEGAAQGQAGSGMVSMLIWMVPLFGIMYFLMIRPQKKQQREHDEMLRKVKAGDKVMLSCGLLGTIVKVGDKKVTVAIADKVNVEFLMAAVAEVIKEEAADAAKAEVK